MQILLKKNDIIVVDRYYFSKKFINYFKNKYGNRWNIEIYFKHIKKKFIN